MRDYEAFLSSKAVSVPEVGFEPKEVPEYLYPFQRDLFTTAVRRGRSAILAECGLGKTPLQLAWANAVREETGHSVLILAPLAVAHQTVREAKKFGVSVRYATDDANINIAKGEVIITNYERLKNFDPVLFEGVVTDESSVLKAYSGALKRRIIESFANTPYRLACTATPAPNDHLELGNHAEFLSAMGSNEMIARWFINDTSQFGTYRLKGHAVDDFWDWVASWATMCALPSDVGDFSDDGYVLPELKYFTHVVDVDLVEGRQGTLFRIPEMSATSIHQERRRTAKDRARKVAELVASEPTEPWILWAETDYEADELAKAIPEAVNVRGSDKNKEDALLGFSSGSIRVLITKPKIAAFGLNWQHCARVCFVSATFSFESWYQAVRRCWRFGQHRPVHVHMVMGSTESAVVDILSRKRREFEKMRDAMLKAARRRQRKELVGGQYKATVPMTLPPWLKSEVA